MITENRIILASAIREEPFAVPCLTRNSAAYSGVAESGVPRRGALCRHGRIGKRLAASLKFPLQLNKLTPEFSEMSHVDKWRV